jgi:TRAP-type C4-dicarboxylate transport system permease small subunit
MPKSSSVKTVLSAVASAMQYAALALLVLLSALVITQIVCRNFFDLGLPWADELARFCGMAIVFLAMPRLLLDDKHISMDLVPAMLGPSWKNVFRIIGGLLTFAFSAIILWALYKFLLRAAKFATPALGIPNLVYYAPAILGFLFLCAVVLLLLFKPELKAELDPESDT